jgi:hypothetical protein
MLYVCFDVTVAATGQAFPLRTVEETVRILKIYNGSNDFEGIYGRRVIHGRYAYEYIELAERGKAGARVVLNMHELC